MNILIQRSGVKHPKLALLPALLAGSLAASVPQVHAVSFDTGIDDLKLRLDTTIKYSTAVRLKSRSDVITADANTDDGDRNFGKGIVSNRFDMLGEFDVSYKDFGARLSGAAWYDTVYNESNDHDSPLTSNNTSVPYDEFNRETRNRMGRKAELLDAFVYLKGSVGGMAGTVRLGRHSLVFGESLFFGANGIANAQGPIDLVKLLNVPSSQFKEVLRPVKQISGQLKVTSDLSVAAYYQFKWEKTIIPPAGSYLSSSDIAGEGAESAGGPFAWRRGADIKPKNSGQGGLQLKYRVAAIDTEFGVYAARYHDKTPNFYLATDFTTPGPVFPFTPQSLVHTYAEGIRLYGLSASTNFFGVNFAAEASVRNNTPLVSDPILVQYNAGNDNRDNAAYAIGKTGHAQISAIYLLQASDFWEGGSFLGEIAWNRTLSVAKNAAALDRNTTRDAYALRVVFSPSYYQVIPGLDLSVPIGVGYNPKGRSSAVFGFNGGVERGGDFSVGLTGIYENAWEFGVTYVRYLGKAAPLVTPPNDPSQYLSYRQALKDRDFVSLNIKRSF